MKKVVILSGKGGTGKTSLSAAFAHLSTDPNSRTHAVFVDADVDASNLNLLLQPISSTPHEFWGGKLAELNPDECSGCGNCVSVCRFDAVLPGSTQQTSYQIDPTACDGCAACIYICPNNAIRMVQQQEGHWFQSSTRYGTLFHAELFPGAENSGKLVTLVKQKALLWAEDTNASFILVDGPPGIGCPVISACAGADLGIIVTEPGLSGLHDLKRVLATLQHFHIPALICINKADISHAISKQIWEYASSQGISILGEIPFDESIPLSILSGVPVTEKYPQSPAAQAMMQIWSRALEQLGVREVQA